MTDRVIAICILASFMLFSFAGSTIASMPGFPEPKWHSVSVGLVKFCRPGETGTLRFTFRPLIESDFTVTVKLNMPPAVKLSKTEPVTLRSSGMKAVHADFDITVAKDSAETGNIEYTATYPAEKIIAIFNKTYGKAPIEENKILIGSIEKRPKTFASSVPVALYVTAAESAVNPEGYFEKTAAGLFGLKMDMSLEDAKPRSENFRMRYSEIFEMTPAEQKMFIKRTDCDVDMDLSNYLVSQCVIDEKMGSDKKIYLDPVVPPEKLFDLIDSIKNFNKPGTGIKNIRYNINKTVIDAVGYLDHFIIAEAKKGNFAEAYKRTAGLIDILGAQKIDEDLKKRLLGYLHFNAANLSGALKNSRQAGHLKSALEYNGGLSTK